MTLTEGRAAVRPETQLDPVEPPAPRRRRWLPVAIVATLVPLLVLSGWWYAAAGPGAFTTVPHELRGATATDAEAALLAADLEVVTVEQFHPNVPLGAVITTSTPEGTELRKDTAVTVVVSKGPDLREIWVDGAGLPLEEVEHALVAAGFEVPAAEHVYSDTVPAGVVVSMTTADGTPVALGDRFPVGTTVTVTCSDGKEPVTIPDVVGMPKDAAVAALEAAGLTVTVGEAYSTVAAGVVASQSPVAGAAGFRLDTVAITVSKGPEPAPPPAARVTIPSSIIGMGKFPALDLLAAKGFQGRYERGSCTVDWAQCVVAKTVPAAGTSQPKGSKVTIWLTNPAGVDTSPAVIPAGIIGMAKHPALDLLSTTGFTPRYERNTCTLSWELCVVEYTVPAAGTTQPKGSVVTIWLRDPV